MPDSFDRVARRGHGQPHDRQPHDRQPHDRQPGNAELLPTELLPAELLPAVRGDLDRQRLDQATARVLQWMERRIAAGDAEMQAAQLLLQHYILLICRLPPLSHLQRVPLRPDDRLYACFDEFISLTRRQDDQVNELLTMLSELT